MWEGRKGYNTISIYRSHFTGGWREPWNKLDACSKRSANLKKKNRNVEFSTFEKVLKCVLRVSKVVLRLNSVFLFIVIRNNCIFCQKVFCTVIVNNVRKVNKVRKARIALEVKVKDTTFGGSSRSLSWSMSWSKVGRLQGRNEPVNVILSSSNVSFSSSNVLSIFLSSRIPRCHPLIMFILFHSC